MGARLRWAWPTNWTICASNVCAPTRSARITNEPVVFMVAPMTGLLGDFSDGIDSPVIIDSSMALRPSRSTPSTGTFSPGRTRRRSPGFTCSSGISFSVTSPPASATTRRAVFGLRSRRARKGGAGGGAGRWGSATGAGSDFHHLTEQDQRGDGGGSLEVHVWISAHATQRLGKNPRREGRDYAVAVGHARAQANQREHCGASVDQRCPETLKEWKATPQDHRSRQRELKPGEI